MATEAPIDSTKTEEKVSSQEPEAAKKKKKKKKKKKVKKSAGSIRASYGAATNSSWNRRESIPHHATVQSLASINQPHIVKKLSKMSQDLKYHRELTKALMELKQKDEDYRYAIEIGESLTKENQYFKEQIELLESQLHVQETDNDILKEKLETLSQTYHQDLYKYHQDLQHHKEIVNELTHSLHSKDQELHHQKELAQKQMARNSQMQGNGMQDEAFMGDADIKYMKMTSEDINNLTSNDFTSNLEKQLYVELEKEKKKHLQDQQTIDTLMKKLDDMMDLKKKYDNLKKENKNLKEITKQELAQHIQMQKSIEAEAIYLAARKANLEEEREDLLNLLDQRDYEITMLNQQLALQRKTQTRTNHAPSEVGGTMADDIPYQDEDDQDFYPYDPDGDEMSESDQDEMAFLKDILDDENFNAVVQDDDEEEEDEDDVIQEQMKQQQIGSPSNKSITSPKAREKKEITEESRDKKAFDKIKEYLHLTASAVKIKYPTVKNVQSDELIKRVKELPFYKYHDQMVRIMEQQIKKQKKLQAQDSLEEDGPPPGLQKRKSFLSIFNIFGAGNNDPTSDDEGSVDGDYKSDLSDNEEGDDSISTRRKRRKSGGGKRRRSVKRRKQRKSSLSSDPGDPGNNNGDEQQQQKEKEQVQQSDAALPSASRYRRGLSVQASQQRLNNNI